MILRDLCDLFPLSSTFFHCALVVCNLFSCCFQLSLRRNEPQTLLWTISSHDLTNNRTIFCFDDTNYTPVTQTRFPFTVYLCNMRFVFLHLHFWLYSLSGKTQPRNFSMRKSFTLFQGWAFDSGTRSYSIQVLPWYSERQCYVVLLLVSWVL